jgi:hypothetical protein
MTRRRHGALDQVQGNQTIITTMLAPPFLHNQSKSYLPLLDHTHTHSPVGLHRTEVIRIGHSIKDCSSHQQIQVVIDVGS